METRKENEEEAVNRLQVLFDLIQKSVELEIRKARSQFV
jgi:hypothetical protein